MADSCILMDVISEDPAWRDWSERLLLDCMAQGVVVINSIIYAELTAGFTRIEDLGKRLPASAFEREEVPWEAAFLAGQCFRAYRRRSGTKRSPLSDFYIGAHALVRGYTLITRDAARFRTYFPQLRLIAP